MRKLQLFIIVCLVSLSSCAQIADRTKLDTYLQTLADNNKFMGSVAISVNGAVVYSKAVGFADIETQNATSTHTKFRIGSISKMFTTVLVFKAVEEHKLDLGDHLSKYFPAIKNAEKITIGNLLNHRSGIHNFTATPDYLSWNTSPQTDEQLLARIIAGGSDFEPDSKASYSNSNFVVLSLLLQKIYQKSYKALLAERIIVPLGVKHTYYGAGIDLKNNECSSYKFAGGKWVKEPETDMSVPSGAGAVVSDPEDLTIFISSLFAGKLISDNSLAQMMNIKEGYGMGMFSAPFGDKKLYGHSGGIDGFTSVLYYAPSDHMSVAITCNGTNFSNNDILIAALSSYYGKPYTIPDFKVTTYTPANLDEYPGTYASKQMPLKIVITKNDKVLIAQATGQSPFNLTATGKDVFSYDEAGIVLEFKPALHQMVLKQRGATYLFEKE
jgi:D-alanyl-D-alanine carboxypeptidase